MTENEKIMLIETEQRAKSNTKRIDKLEEENKTIYKMAISIEVMANEIQNMVTQMSDIKMSFSGMESKIDSDIHGVKQDVTNIDAKISKIQTELSEVKHLDSKQKAARWDDVWSKIQWVFLGGIATFIMSQLVDTLFK